MSTKELAAKYGKSRNATQNINKAIRAELPGGNEALDALDQLRLRGGPGLELVHAIVEAMAAEIRRRYGLPLRSDPMED